MIQQLLQKKKSAEYLRAVGKNYEGELVKVKSTDQSNVENRRMVYQHCHDSIRLPDKLEQVDAVSSLSRLWKWQR
jgi:acid stress-induced BolA-like protein IbaG/YrbA